MRPIWVIEQGEYSERFIVGYTDDEKKAQRLCAEHNRKIPQDGRPKALLEWSFDEVEFLDDVDPE